jgi:hypothetical protein
MGRSNTIHAIGQSSHIAANAVLDGGMEDLDTFDKVVSALKSWFGIKRQTDKFRDKLHARK